jgi:hypothetical protein
MALLFGSKDDRTPQKTKSPEQGAALDSLVPAMMFEKTR